jgi:hypothetical protein
MRRKQDAQPPVEEAAMARIPALRGRSLLRLLLLPTAVLGLVGAQSGGAQAATPYPVNVHVSTHRAVEFDPNWLFDASPCFVATGDLTEVFNAEGHALAAGINADGSFIAPLHFQQNVEESVLFDPYALGLPTYSGHATVHVTNFENSPRAGFTNTVILRGTDGSHLLFHENFHLVAKATGVVLTVDHRHARC